MKVSLNWLTDYVDVSAFAAAELGEVFTRTGLCCEGIEHTESDVVFDLEVTSNRPDCLGHVGVARELAAALSLELKLPDLSAVPAGAKRAGKLTSVEVLDPDLCPRYTARVITGVKIGPSPAWLLERLAAVGLRSINNVVDVTNYVLMEYSQPLHAFDYALLAGSRIVVRRARDGEELVSIDGTRCRLTAEMLIIADAERPVAIAGVMGGLQSEVADKTDAILLESAQFDPTVTRKTARELTLMSESSYRFERGVDPVGVDAASLRAAQLILQTAGGELAEGVVDVWAEPYTPPKVALRPDRCRALLGMDVDDAAQAEILARLGLSPRRRGGRITCSIPPWRGDLTREADLIEEVARLAGFERIPVRNKVTHPLVGFSPAEQARRDLRAALSASGFDEAVTFGFVDEAEAALFGFAAGVQVDARVRRSNNVLRPTLLPSLLRSCKTNQDVGNDDVSLYELAAVFRPRAGGTADGRPAENVELCLVSRGELRTLRGAAEAAIRKVAPRGELTVVQAAAAGLAEGAAAEIRLDGETVGVIGVVSEAVLEYYGLEKPHVAAAVNFDAVMEQAGGERRYKPLPRFPAVRRDLSLLVDEQVNWQQLAEAIRSEKESALEALEYVGAYHGEQVPPGKKSVTVSLIYRCPDQTLRHEQVDELVGRVLQGLKRRLGAELRS